MVKRVACKSDILFQLKILFLKRDHDNFQWEFKVVGIRAKPRRAFQIII